VVSSTIIVVALSVPGVVGSVLVGLELAVPVAVSVPPPSVALSDALCDPPVVASVASVPEIVAVAVAVIVADADADADADSLSRPPSPHAPTNTQTLAPRNKPRIDIPTSLSMARTIPRRAGRRAPKYGRSSARALQREEAGPPRPAGPPRRGAASVTRGPARRRGARPPSDPRAVAPSWSPGAAHPDGRPRR